MSEYIVGLRGGIGTGKSIVSRLFAERGIAIADADIAARRVVEPDRPAYNAIVKHFGDEVLDKDGVLNRAKLREIVFKDSAKRTRRSFPKSHQKMLFSKIHVGDDRYLLNGTCRIMAL